MGTVANGAGKTFDPMSRNEYYIPTLQVVHNLRQECVDPHRGGSVYLHASLLKDKDEV